MTLSPDCSPVLRGADVAALPVASLIAVEPMLVDAEILDASEEVEVDVDEGPSVEELVAHAYQAGFDEGAAAAESTLRATLAASLAALDEAVSDLAAARNAWEQVGPGHAIDIALDIAEMVVMREIRCSTDPGRDALVRCLSEVDRSETAVVRLHPSDLSNMGPFEDLLADRSFELVPDPDLVSGDAVADTTTGSVDARLRGALGRVREELLR